MCMYARVYVIGIHVGYVCCISKYVCFCRPIGPYMDVCMYVGMSACMWSLCIYILSLSILLNRSLIIGLFLSRPIYYTILRYLLI